MIEVDTTTSAYALTSRAKLWIVDTFKSANAVIQYQDSAQVVGKGRSVYNDYQDITYTVAIESKLGRSRVRIYAVSVESNGKTINVGAGPMPVQSLGPIYEEDVCYTPVPYGFQSITKATMKTIANCKTALPKIVSTLEGLITSAESRLRSAAQSDW